MKKFFILIVPGILFSYYNYPNAGMWIGSSFTYGSQAIFYNPALLGSKLNPSFSFSFPLSGFLGFTNNTFSLSWWNKMADKANQGDTLNYKDKEEFYGSIPGRFFKFHLGADLTGLSFAYKYLGFGMRIVNASFIKTTKDFWSLSFFGNKLGKKYDLKDFDAEAISYLENKISFGYKYDYDEDLRILYGLGFSYILGIGYAEVLDFKAALNSGFREIEGYDTLKARYGVGGEGFSFDLGFGANYKERFSIGLSFSNIFSSLKWGTGFPFGIDLDMDCYAEEGYHFGRIEDFNIWNLLDKEKRESLGVDTSDTYEIDPFSKRLPIILRLGITYFNPEKMWKIFFDYEQGFKERALSSTMPKFSLGFEYPLASWFLTRVGTCLGGHHGVSFSYGIGFSFDHFYIDLGYSHSRGFFYGSNGEALSFYWGLRTPMKGRIRGTIEDSITGKPLVAEVNIYKGDKLVKKLSSDQNGFFSYSLTPGDYIIHVVKEKYFPKKLPAVVKASKITDLTFKLVPTYGILALRIKDALTGEPVQPDITFKFKDKEEKLKPDTLGFLKMQLDAGEYTFIFEHPDYYKRVEAVVMKPALFLEKEILLKPNKGIVMGKVYNAQTQEPLVANMVIKDSLGKIVKEIQSKPDGTYEVVLFAGTHLFEVSVPTPPTVLKYIPQAAYVAVRGGEKNIKNFAMIQEKMVFTFRNIYFDFNKATIRPESYPILDSIAQVLKDNPTMKVEIGGHADERGTRAYNYRLTDARANSVRTYFITKHGIDARRLVAIGYGEDRPVVPNARTEEQHQLNRRVEFKILGEIK